MTERKYDNLLGIRTIGIREWRGRNLKFNRCEPTPYEALEILFQHYKLYPNDRLVDFGCGRGRIAFYIHNRFKIPVTGIEVGDKNYSEAIENKSRYMEKAGHIGAPIKFKFGLAENYKIGLEDNRFYFFNPFSIDTFMDVVKNIKKSLGENPREADIILYYPMPDYKQFLGEFDSFRILNKIRMPKLADDREKFIIYRYG